VTFNEVILSKVHNIVQTIVFESYFFNFLILNILGCMNSRRAFIYLDLVGFQIIYIFNYNLIKF
jgi:hypothetical protein